MPKDKSLDSKHFSLEQLAVGIFACIHKLGGAAYSNAGIIDLGDRTLLVDSFDTMAAGRDLRHIAEALFNRPVDTIVLTHPHSDHWIGASAFDSGTSLLASEVTRQICIEWGERILEDIQNPAEWEEWLQEMQQQLQTETDPRVRVSLENSIQRTRYTMAEMAEFQPRYADQTFANEVIFHGSQRAAVLRSYGRGHSEDDAVVLLPDDEIAFIGDIGFFDTQPFLGYCDLKRYREQLLFFQASDFKVLVPGHGPVGYNKDYINLQIQYLDVMQELVAQAEAHLNRPGRSLSPSLLING
jgi:cyclase